MQFGAGGTPLPAQAASAWPTPTTRDHKDGSYCPNVPVNGLLGRVVCPTPTANQYGSNQGGAAGRTGPVRGSVATIAKSMWPTPTSLAQAKDGNNEAGNSAGLVAIRKHSIGSSEQTEKRGALNPEFVSWLMGYPPEWLSCAPSETRSIRGRRRNSSPLLESASTE